MSDDAPRLQEKIESLEREVASLKQSQYMRGQRKRSTTIIWGMPLYDIATGPDPDNNESRGHARGIFAFGDVATGVFAFGGVARGLVAVGGLAIGVITFGGCSLGLLLGCGGLGTGLFAMGGAAIGFVAAGSFAVGYYACGVGAIGKYVVSLTQQQPEAVQFFDTWAPWIKDAVLRGRK